MTISGIAAVAMTLTAAAPALAAPGDPTITLPINDSAAGGTYSQDFTRVYDGVTPDGTPVYIYVPKDTPLDGSAPAGVASLDPAFDHDPGDDFTPCADATAAEFTITQAQIDYMGDQLANHIVAIDEEHYGPMGDAVPGDDSTDALVMVVYNVQDDAYYDCAETSYTAGYFAPDFLEDPGMNVIVIDALDWANRVGPADSPWNDGDATNDRPTLYEGVIAHELEHLLHNYSDPGELSWVDEGLADFAVFLNGYDVGGSHLSNHQVFYADTSLTRWGGSLANYGAAYTFFQYVWEQAGGNGDGTYTPDFEYDGAGGDLLIKLIFQNQADGMDGVQAAIDQFNAQTGANLRSAKTIYQDWAVAVYLDDEGSSLWDIKAVDFGNPADTRWTMDIADNDFWGGRGSNQGAQPDAKWNKRSNGQVPVAVPYGIQVERFRNPGPNVTVSLDGDDSTVIAPHTGETHWYAGYQSQFDSILNLDVAAGVTSLDFWTWHFIEEGWDYGFVEALVGGEWVTVPLVDDAGTTVTSNDDPHGGNPTGNGLTGTSGGAYFIDDPEYIHLTAQLPAGATDVRFRYSTDAAYLDTGWFVDDVMVNGAAATVSADSDWYETTGEQNNNWTLQVISTCDLTPGVVSPFEITDGQGNYVYRLEGDAITQGGFNTKCANGKNRDFATLVSNLPTGDLTFLDAGYALTVKNKK
ncbi:immune inhibitor A [Microbacterium sp. SS28]|uniref:immune inhibitor A n=1 Tax=Microbacterium sp. SS28 TaxID=2919948 RepID=UPI001FA9F095|nr:immune inhibitor A [Microbacterium sp. SS28]